MVNFFALLLWPFKAILLNVALWFVAVLIRIFSLVNRVEVKKGNRFVTAVDISTYGSLFYKAPFSSDFKCVIPKGTILVALDDRQPMSVAFRCIPENTKEFEKQFVPMEARTSAKYDGYCLTMKFWNIGRSIKRL